MAIYEQCTRCRCDVMSCGVTNGLDDTWCEHFVQPIDNSKMFDRWYKFSGRIGRLEYIMTLTGCILLYFITLGLMRYLILVNEWYIETTVDAFVFAFACMIPSAYLAMAAGVKRAHDAEVSAWYALTPLIPVFFLNIITFVLFCAGCIFLFANRGVDGINEYGSNPTQPYKEQLEFEY